MILGGMDTKSRSSMNMGQQMSAQGAMPKDARSEIAREQQSLADAVEALGKVVMEMHERLRPVVRQQPPTEGLGGIQTQEQTCYSSVGVGINSATCLIRSDVDRLYQLMQSLAV